MGEGGSRLPRAPGLRRGPSQDRLTWEAARALAGVATPETAALWIEKAEQLPLRELLTELRGGRPPREKLVLWLDDEQQAWVDAAIDAVRRAGGPFNVTAALVEALKLALAEGAGRGLGYRVVIDVCAVCDLATRETAQGSVPVEPALVEVARCCGEVLDIREGPAAVQRSVPPKVRNYLGARDRNRCQVPACRNRSYVDVHHAQGRRKGHDPDQMLLLCDVHHRMCHDGWLKIEGPAPEFRFFRGVDGAYLGRTGDETLATGPSEAWDLFA